MTRQEAYYRVKLSGMIGAGVVAETEALAPKSEKQTVKFADVKAEAKTATGVFWSSRQTGVGCEKGRQAVRLRLRQGLHLRAYVDSRDDESEVNGCSRWDAVANEAGYHQGDPGEEIT